MVPTFAKVLIAAGIFIGLFLWISQEHPLLAIAGGPPSISLSNLQAGAIAAPKVAPEFQSTGMVIIDLSSGLPGAPYLLYENAKHEFLTKTLLFDGGRGCQIDAGELPCARSIDGTDGSDSDASPVPSGTPVTITGTENDQGVFIQTYTATSSIPDMVTFAATVGQTVNLSNGLSLTFAGIDDSARCILGAGCFGDGETRAEVTISNRTDTTQTELAIGRLFTYGDSLVSLVSAPTSDSGSGPFTFLVAAHQ